MVNRVTGRNITESGGGKSTPSIPISSGRVKYCILDNKEYPKDFKRLGGYASIGTVIFQRIMDKTSKNDPSPSDLEASPLFPNSKNYPLNGEIIFIISLPETFTQTVSTKVKYYYFQPLNIWNSVHHNVLPDSFNIPKEQPQDYEQVESGAIRKSEDNSTEITLGNTFEEKLNIKNLQPYEGDVIHEGRWGQSIRFGSTVKGETNWSATGENGDPITIVRNGQHEDGKDPWIPQVEDINKDKSSVYLTSTQAIPIEVASKDYKSYKTSPISPSKYTNEQIVLNSSRLLFNSKSDSILMSSAKSISLNSIESVNIDSPTTTINSKEIYLGDKNASESVILGDKFLTDMSKLLTQIIALGTALQTPIGTPVPGVPNAAIPIPATQLVEMAKKMFNNVQTYKSKVTKTK